MPTTKQKITSFQYSWVKAMPLLRAYLLDLGESIRKDLNAEMASKNSNPALVKELTTALKSVVGLLSAATDSMQLFFGEDSLKELPAVRYAGSNNFRRTPYVRRGNWGGSRPNSGIKKKAVAPAPPQPPALTEQDRIAMAAFDSLSAATKDVRIVSVTKNGVATYTGSQPAKEDKKAKKSKPAKTKGSLIAPLKKKPATKPAPKRAAKPAPKPPAIKTPQDTVKDLEARFDAILDIATRGNRPNKED